MTKNRMIKILAYRFSAMGDVALCLPIIKSVLDLNPKVEITFVTRKEFSFLYKDIPRLKIYEANFSGQHKGVFGLWKLFRELNQLDNFDYICDLHQVTRSQILNLFFFQKPVFKINKERMQKKYFMKNPESAFLKHTTQRYLDLFRNIKLNLPQTTEELISYGYTVIASNEKVQELQKIINGYPAIGIAPFAKHFTKTWPFEYFEKLIILLKSFNVKVLLYGGPEDEAKLKPWEKLNPNVTCLAGNYSLEEELALMKNLDLMITMDSANMHFAMLCGAPSLSIWGATHPGFGFYPLDKRAQILQVPTTELSCRPCSLFGGPTCPEGHFECMFRLKPELVLAKIKSTLKLKEI